MQFIYYDCVILRNHHTHALSLSSSLSPSPLSLSILTSDHIYATFFIQWNTVVFSIFSLFSFLSCSFFFWWLWTDIISFILTLQRCLFRNIKNFWHLVTEIFRNSVILIKIISSWLLSAFFMHQNPYFLYPHLHWSTIFVKMI